VPRNKYPEETVQKILDVSLQLFMEKGFEQTTVLDIVAGLGGMTRGAFYHHFKSKEEVLTALLEQHFGGDNAFKEAVTADVKNGLERVKLAMKLALKRNTATEQDAALMNMYIPLISNPRFLAEKLKDDIESAKFFEPMIAEGMADGSIRKGNPKLMSELLMVLVNYWMFPALFPADAQEMFEKAEMIAEIFESLGFNVLDEEMWEQYKNVMNALNI